MTRSGSNVTGEVGASYYNARQHKQIPWVAAAVQIQTSNALDGLAARRPSPRSTTGKDGTVTKAFRAPSARYLVRPDADHGVASSGRYSVPVWR